MDDLDPVNPEVAQLIQLFSAQVDLQFPDLDAPILQDALVKVRERHSEVERAELAVAAARNALDEDQEALLKKAQRAQAYLRIFAETDAALLEKVQAIALPKSRRTPRSETTTVVGSDVPRKRGRPRKVQSVEESLFAVSEQSPG